MATNPIAITFAVPQESGVFLRQVQNFRRVRVGDIEVGEGMLRMTSVRVAHVGIGLECAKMRTSAFLEKFRPSLLIAAGFAGGLDPALEVGDVVVDVRASGFPLPSGGSVHRTGSIATTPHALETPREKANLHQQTGTVAVDMETDAIAAVCADHGIPLLAIRAISDRAADPLPVPLPAWYDLQHQRPRPLVLMGYLASHPGAIGPFFRFLLGLPLARRNLSEAITQLVGRLQM